MISAVTNAPDPTRDPSDLVLPSSDLATSYQNVMAPRMYGAGFFEVSLTPTDAGDLTKPWFAEVTPDTGGPSPTANRLGQLFGCGANESGSSQTNSGARNGLNGLTLDWDLTNLRTGGSVVEGSKRYVVNAIECRISGVAKSDFAASSPTFKRYAIPTGDVAAEGADGLAAFVRELRRTAQVVYSPDRASQPNYILGSMEDYPEFQPGYGGAGANAINTPFGAYTDRSRARFSIELKNAAQNLVVNYAIGIYVPRLIRGYLPGSFVTDVLEFGANTSGKIAVILALNLYGDIRD